MSEPAFVLVHSPLVGPSTWVRTAQALLRQGRVVAVPDITLPDERDRDCWQCEVDSVVAGTRPLRGAPVVLVAHSGAGPLLPIIAAALPAPPVGYVLCDAGLPHPARSRLDAMPPEFADRVRGMAQGGWLPPWPEWFPATVLDGLIPDAVRREAFRRDCPRLPVALFEEALPPTGDCPPGRSGYLQLSEAYDADRAQAEAQGWAVDRLEGHHLWPLVHPQPVADALVRLATRLG